MFLDKKSSSNYKPKEVEYKDIEHYNSTALINSFIDNNTAEAAEQHEEEQKAAAQQERMDFLMEDQKTQDKREAKAEAKKKPDILSYFLYYFNMFALMGFVLFGVLFIMDSSKSNLLISAGALVLNIIFSILLIKKSKKAYYKVMSIVILLLDIAAALYMIFGLNAFSYL